MAWLGNGLGMVRKWARMFIEGCKNVYDEVRSGLPALVNDDFVCKVKKECVMTDVSQFLICPCTFLRFQGLYDMSVVIWVVANITGSRIL
jgi:hypothetical protein